MKHLLAGLLFVVCFLVVIWHVLAPSHQRDWVGSQTILPAVATTSDGYIVHNIRNWSYSPSTGEVTGTETIAADLTLADVTDVYFIVESFSTRDSIAHTMLSFHFDNGEAYVVSVEARREVGEEYSAFLAALWPIHEYLYVWATERDMFAETTFVHGDDLHRYRLSLSDAEAQFLLRTMLEETAAVAATPRWYNTLFSNCTNVLAQAVNKKSDTRLPWHYARILPGYSPHYLYNQRFLDTNKSLHILREVGHLTPHIEEVYRETDPVRFSQWLNELMWLSAAD